ncbi:MAG: hypothetical protein GX977_02020 [Firmicutes bacterium]|nr:hypothetical protein [Bacillota bacterium]
MKEHWIWLTILVCVFLVLNNGTVLAEEPIDYKLNMQMRLEKAEKPVTLFGDLAASKDSFKLGLRYRAMPNIYVALHGELSEDHPIDVETIYRIPIGMEYANLYAGLGVSLANSALFNGYLIGGVEAALVFLQMNYHTDAGELIGWGGLRIPIF